jgi:hypothetical protein
MPPAKVVFPPSLTVRLVPAPPRSMVAVLSAAARLLTDSEVASLK